MKLRVSSHVGDRPSLSLRCLVSSLLLAGLTVCGGAMTGSATNYGSLSRTTDAEASYAYVIDLPVGWSARAGLLDETKPGMFYRGVSPGSLRIPDGQHRITISFSSGLPGRSHGDPGAEVAAAVMLVVRFSDIEEALVVGFSFVVEDIRIREHEDEGVIELSHQQLIEWVVVGIDPQTGEEFETVFFGLRIIDP